MPREKPSKEKSSQYKQYELPQATVNRLIKEVCSPKINIGKNAKSAISKSAAVFILYLAWNANEICTSNGRSTIQAQDVLNALEECEFSEFIPELEAHLAAYRTEHQQIKETEKSKANERKRIQRQKSLQELKEKKKKELEMKMNSNNNNNNNNNIEFDNGNENEMNDIEMQNSLSNNENSNISNFINNSNIVTGTEMEEEEDIDIEPNGMIAMPNFGSNQFMAPTNIAPMNQNMNQNAPSMNMNNVNNMNNMNNMMPPN